MGFMQRVKVMLGLADEYEDEPLDDYGPDDDELDDDRYGDERDRYSAPAPRYGSPYDSEPASVRRVTREPDLVRARKAAPLRSVAPAPEPAPAAPPQVKIHTVEARSYAEAQSIADKFKAGQPVIINLSETDPELAKRLLDFASGLTYGLDGGLQKVSERVFMLTPKNVDVSAADRYRSRSNIFGE
jgi:cell division inhibitor SepF